MRNKILVIDSDVKAKIAFEEALEHFVADGGELFVANQLKSAISVVKQEHPQLIFVSTQTEDFDQSILESFEGKVILLSKEELIKNQFPSIKKPLKSHAILEKCSEVFKQKSKPDFRFL